MVTEACVMRRLGSAHVNQELVVDSVIDATRMPTIQVEDVLVSVNANHSNSLVHSRNHLPFLKIFVRVSEDFPIAIFRSQILL